MNFGETLFNLAQAPTTFAVFPVTILLLFPVFHPMRFSYHAVLPLQFRLTDYVLRGVILETDPMCRLTEQLYQFPLPHFFLLLKVERDILEIPATLAAMGGHVKSCTQKSLGKVVIKK